ncbi:UDP-2,3-diacylglucosamine diphosphatase [Desulfobulbus elongatus]|uniref:UDP-2,3-diacylglucosamine diphosphatase n=1 Tax=Desulfobulbus elongatus TaxID=53332 RepID=UPI000A046AAF|nr:UDP-2,3-diacylglucosamine diphosphatase [Desulfobulbus elongatus]
MPPHHFRSLWISDLHLGTRSLQREHLLDFLLQTESEYLYLVGDIFDLLQAQKRWHWPAINDRIVRAILAKAENGTKVVYIPGNHDHMLRTFDGCIVSNIRIQNNAVHETADGRRYLVLHGDTFDPVVQHSPWLASIGSALYDVLLLCNRWFNFGRRRAGRQYFSLSSWLKHQAKIAVNYMARFEEVVARAAAEHRVDGLICGHIHRASIRQIGPVLYTNSGDWVESCTALAENHCGRLGVIEWRRHQPLQEAAAAKAYEDLYRDRCLASPN